ncbi:MAG: aminomethyl-transferring glycine dehydrogenase subunit GcvPB [Deltaproteobacteria bacterium]|jgi:glycine dehydrogenase subunit 2|nr:aminomethyl-transferring glycine dehydrogenase subunit GcvPB [Deltaproteobacteria bacterium]
MTNRAHTPNGHGTEGLLYEEPTLFEQSAKGRKGICLGKADVPEMKMGEEFGSLVRDKAPDLPELAEVDVVRHFTRLSIQNYSKDLGFYPLGSCTMKHNPRIANKAAAMPGFTDTHPYQPADSVQGNLELCYELENMLAKISGMDSVTLWPAAGSHGELTGMLMIRAYHTSKGNPRSKVLIPDSAHGTNPASAAICHYKVQSIKSGPDGLLDPSAVEEAMDEEVAAIMITNPNTLGIFEENFKKVADIVHSKGGLVYLDGANLNALMGYVKPGEIGADVMHFNLHKTFGTPHGGGGPGAGPVGVVKELSPFLPLPRINKNEDHYNISYNSDTSIGRINTFFGNFAVLVRAYTYIRELGATGLKEATEMAVLNANYIRARLSGTFNLPYDKPVLHECVFNDKIQNEFGVKTLDIAKRLMDYGFHPPTVYFPLIVSGAIMIEPTETECKSILDDFCDAMIAIAKECEKDPDLVKTAPHHPFRRRIDEVKAAKEMCLKD